MQLAAAQLRRRQRRKRKTNFISANAYRVNAVQFRRLLVRRRRVAGGEGAAGKHAAQVGGRAHRRLDGFNFLGPVRNNSAPAWSVVGRRYTDGPTDCNQFAVLHVAKAKRRPLILMSIW